MKLLREHINEKFTDIGDPIQHMEIGLRKLLSDFEINKVYDLMPEKTEEAISKLFREPINHLYYLGNSEYTVSKTYRTKIEKLIYNKKPIKKLKMYVGSTFKYARHEEYFALYDTSIGKIMVAYDIGYSPEYSSTEADAEKIYIGDLEAAANLDILNKRDLLL